MLVQYDNLKKRLKNKEFILELFRDISSLAVGILSVFVVNKVAKTNDNILGISVFALSISVLRFFNSSITQKKAKKNQMVRNNEMEKAILLSALKKIKHTETHDVKNLYNSIAEQVQQAISMFYGYDCNSIRVSLIAINSEQNQAVDKYFSIAETKEFDLQIPPEVLKRKEQIYNYLLSGETHDICVYIGDLKGYFYEEWKEFENCVDPILSDYFKSIVVFAMIKKSESGMYEMNGFLCIDCLEPMIDYTLNNSLLKFISAVADYCAVLLDDDNHNHDETLKDGPQS